MRKLYFGYNQIKTINPLIRMLKDLILLDLDHNDIIIVPEELADCKKLGVSCWIFCGLMFSPPSEYLEFAHNSIKIFPDEIPDACEKLRYLGLESNRLSRIPPSCTCNHLSFLVA